ncbi:MAG TPA: hypothetical protein VGC41_27895 [Kofleriaceae bacterium]
MNIDDALTTACERVPGLVHGALVLLPDGFLLGATRGTRMHDLEPVVRSAGKCVANSAAPALGGRDIGTFVEYVFVIHDQLVVIQLGRRDPRLALVVVTSTEPNLGFVLNTTRLVVGEVEQTVDLARWGV